MQTKNERKRKTKDPCLNCYLHKEKCICHLIPSLDLATKLTLIVHAKELKRTTNTGRLAILALKNSSMFVRGLVHRALDLSSQLDNKYENILLYPDDNAIELSDYLSLNSKRPIQLFVPDGNWRQASKVSIRHPELKHITRVKISLKNEANLHLRKEHFAEGFSTLEAIAKAFGLIEGEIVENQLMLIYHAKLAATLKGRGVN